VRPRETHDPWGRPVVLTSARWMHVLRRHPELVLMIEEILDIVARPDVITPDPDDGRWRYWRAGVGPTRWLRVVVAWREGAPWIVTAFPSGGIKL
jgi:hypothetical protein